MHQDAGASESNTADANKAFNLWHSFNDMGHISKSAGGIVVSGRREQCVHGELMGRESTGWVGSSHGWQGGARTNGWVRQGGDCTRHG